jgi:hypothetical protein
MPSLTDKDAITIKCMTSNMKELTTVLRDSSRSMCRGLYASVMEAIGFSLEALMVALGHLFENRAQGNGFVGIVDDHKVL